MACRECECFSYCKCRCRSFRKEPPTSETFRIYRTRHFVTCCADVCTKFAIRDVVNKCYDCFPKIICHCPLKSCKNRDDWSV